MKNYRVILIAFLAGVAIFSAFKYIASLKEKYDLLNKISQMKTQLFNLESEKQNLLQTLEKEEIINQQLSAENLNFKQDLAARQEKLVKIEADFTQAKKEAEQLNSQIATLNKERDDLRLQLAEVSQEKDTLQARLNSISELKKAIKELKRHMHRVRVVVETKKKTLPKETQEGNRGFLIKDGKPTYSAKIKIEVNPALEK